MKTLLWMAIVVLACAAAIWAQPATVLSVDWTSRSDDSNFGAANEQTSGPVVYDLDEDGQKEVILTGRKDVWVFNTSYPNMTNALFHWQVSAGYEFCSPVTIAHLSNDGAAWVVVGASRAVHFAADSCPFRVEGVCATYGDPPLTDPNCHYHGDCYHWYSMIHAWKITGTGTYEEHFSSADDNRNQRLTTPAAADVDGDGLDELCFVGMNSYGITAGGNVRSTAGVHFYEYNDGFVELLPATRQEVVWGVFGHPGGTQFPLMLAQIVPAAGDVNGDGKAEFITQTYWVLNAYAFAADHQAGNALWQVELMYNGLECIPTECIVNYGCVPWYYADYAEGGNVWPGWDSRRSAGPVLADLDGDGQLDVFVVTGGACPALVWKRNGLDGSAQGQYTPDESNPARVESGYTGELAICDDDESGHPNLFGTMNVINQGNGAYCVRTRRWDNLLHANNGPGFPSPFPYDRAEDAYPHEDIYTPSLLPSEVGAGYTVDIVARDSVIFERCAVHQDWSWYLDDQNGSVQSNITAADLDNDGLMEYVMSNRVGNGTSLSHVYAFETNLPYDPEKNQWSGYRNGPQHTGLYAQPVTGNQARDVTTWTGQITVAGEYIVGANQTLNIRPGTSVRLRTGAKINVRGTIHANGTSSLPITFDCTNPSQKWSRILIAGGNAIINYTTVSKCTTAIALTNNAHATITHSNFSNNERGILCLEHSHLNLSSSTIANNTIYGVDAASGADLTLANVVIIGNGGEHGYGCGMQAIGCNVILKCCQICEDWGPGIFGAGSTILMAGSNDGDPEHPYGGNYIAHNDRRGAAQASEILAGTMTLILDGGANAIFGNRWRRWIKTRAMDCPLKWRGNYWGSELTDTMRIKERLAPTITLSPVMTSWNMCQSTGVHPITASESLYVAGHSLLANGLFYQARDRFRDMPAVQPDEIVCDIGVSSIGGILGTDMMAGDPGYSLGYFAAVADTAQEHSTAMEAAYAQAWELAYTGSLDSAQTIMETALGNVKDDFEMVRAHIELLSLELKRQALDSTTEGLQAVLDSMDYWHKWLTTHLRFDLQQGEIARYQGDSLQVGTAVYLFNAYMPIPSDTITEVGFKFKYLPDSISWTAYQTNVASGDSVYSWQVPVGRLGGLVNYIFWAKDAHGRFATSPVGADTANPDSGMTHFLSVEIGADTITYPDSVVLWAPTTLTHQLEVCDGGILVVKPLPGATDHTVRLGDGFWIDAMTFNYDWDTTEALWTNPPSRWISKLYLLGTEQEPITFAPLTTESGGDSTVWSGICATTYSKLTAKHCIFRSSMYAICQSYPAYCNDSGRIGVQIDSCLFDSVTSSMFSSLSDLDTTSYIRHCEFTRMGTGDDNEDGGIMTAGGNLNMSDCSIHDNAHAGLTLFDCYNSRLEWLNIHHNRGPGLVFGSYVGDAHISCCQISFNGDTLPEVCSIYGGPVLLSHGTHCSISDSAGVLVSCHPVTYEGNSMFQDGQNAFYLLSGHGKYIEQTYGRDTLIISGNHWYPVDPDSSAFLSFFTPDSAQYWNYGTYLHLYADCPQPIGDDAITTMAQPRIGSGDNAAPNDAVNSGPTIATVNWRNEGHTQSKQDLKAAKDLEIAGDHVGAANRFRNVLSKATSADVTAEALSGYFVAARKSGVNAGLSAYYATLRQQLPTSTLRRQAQWLELKSLEVEGQPQQALRGYEEIIRQPEGKADSVAAILSAMRLHIARAQMKKPDLSSAYPQHRVRTAQEFARRSFKLARSLYGNEKLAGIGPRTAPIPNAYKLYQNYPNPFNPVTEIRFDLLAKTRVELRIFNILGQQVTTLVDEVRTAGAYQILWDGKSAGGVPVSSGMYIYQLKCDKFVDAKKMILLR
jgi:hypothetical protein